MEQIEVCISWKGAYESTSLFENIYDAPYQSESLVVFKYCYDNHEDDNAYITEYLVRISPPNEKTNALEEPMEE